MKFECYWEVCNPKYKVSFIIATSWKHVNNISENTFRDWTCEFIPSHLFKKQCTLQCHG